MVILAIDTSHPEGSIALNIDRRRAGSARFGAASSHLLELGECIDEVLRGAGLRIADVSRVALVEGPGSFTGLRVGMAYVKGLAAALDLEVVTAGTLELMARPLLDSRTSTAVCPLVDARKGEVYAAVYETNAVLAEPCVTAPGTFIEAAMKFEPIFVGTGAVRYRHLIKRRETEKPAEPDAAQVPSTEYLAQWAGELVPLSPDAVCSLEPRYLRASDAVFKKLKPIDSHG